MRCNDGITRPVYIMEGNLGDIYHDWTHTNTEQDARRRFDGEDRIDMMGELVMSLWPYSRDARRPGHVVSINRGVLTNAIQAVADVVRGHVRVTDADDSDQEPDHYCKPPTVHNPSGAKRVRPKETIVKKGVPPNRGHDPAIGPPTNKK